MKPTAQKIKQYLEDHHGFYIAPNHTEIMLERVNDKDEVSVTLPVNAGENRKMNIGLVVRFKTIEEFVELAGINDLTDLHRIKNSVCWQQYNLGNGYVSCTVHWLNDAAICFRRTEAHFTHWEERLSGTAITMIYSMDLRYYDEVQTALTLPEQFIEYIDERMERLGTYAALVMERGGFLKM